jgi:hypothetical protein
MSEIWAQAVAELEAERAEIDAALVVVRRWAERKGAPAATPSPAVVTRREAARKRNGAAPAGVSAKVLLAWLQAHPGEYTIAVVADAVRGEPKKIGIQLCALRGVERAGKGIYRAKVAGANGATRERPEEEPRRMEARGAHKSHELYRDGGLLKCRHCRVFHVREEGFTARCDGRALGG